MQFEVIIPLIAYLVVVFGLSLYAMRKRASGSFLNEYFLGSRSMGGFVLAMTLTATYISASSFIGGPGAAYKYGLGWVLLAMIQLPAIWLSLGVLGKKFAILARRYNAVTLNDMLFARYQSRLLVWLASLSLLVAFVGAMTVQFIGGARLLETAAGIPYDTGLLIFGVSIALYTAYGGFRASVLNDTMQGMVMLIGTIVLLVGVIHAAGGVGHAVEDAAVDRRQAGVPAGRGRYPLANLYGLVLGAGLLRRYWSATYRSALYLLQRQQSRASRHHYRHHRGGDPDVWHASGWGIRPGGDPRFNRAGSGDPDADG
ncbi:sodium/panthothenate symporter [Klebsiella pneumoniae]|nr:sodium/panthothenate symporter [Klebsiella pneumoniae]